ncbi:MAG: TetR/AcrR family transcriptional regulator [Oscillospiraceae bacterium]|nr:TetR/AcrR family transcriptional regulator [Oscillospiraceae bacterium]
MTETKNPSAVRSQTEITAALLALMEKHRYEEITVKQIILEARLARKTFYRNFTSKDDVLRSLIRRTLNEYFDIVNNAEGDMLTTVFSYADRNRELLRLLERNDMLHTVLRCTNEYLPMFRSSRLSELNPSVPLFEGLDADYLLALNIGAVWNVIALWVHNGMKDDPEEIRREIEVYIGRMERTRI